MIDFLTLNDKEKTLVNRAKNTLYGNIITVDDKCTPLFCNTRSIAPSPSTYKGVWNWDSAFHLLGMTHFDTQIAHEQSKVIFENILPNGQFVDVVFSTGKVVDRFTKPPVYALCIELSDKLSNCDSFLEYALPYLESNLKWWEEFRYDGYLFSYKVHGMESGWDDSVRFDFPNKIEKLYSIDCNCFMHTFYTSLSYICKRLGLAEKQSNYDKKAIELAKKINDTLYCKKLQRYGDYHIKKKKLTKCISPACFMPLYTNIAPKEYALSMIKLAKDPAYFYKGMPTISYNHAKYKKDSFWRGPCWLNTAYFAIKGLANYGEKSLALEYIDNILDWCDSNGDSIYEYYDSKTGKGLGAKNFGWSSVFIIELILLRKKLV